MYRAVTLCSIGFANSIVYGASSKRLKLVKEKLGGLLYGSPVVSRRLHSYLFLASSTCKDSEMSESLLSGQSQEEYNSVHTRLISKPSPAHVQAQGQYGSTGGTGTGNNVPSQHNSDSSFNLPARP